MTATAHLRTLLGLLVLSIACNNADRPTVPSPLSTLAGTYVFNGPLSYAVANYTTTSRYVLRDSGAFSLEYPSLPFNGSYVGTYTHENGRVLFRFAADARWGAVGTFNGDALEVRYNELAGLSDFEDAVYRRSQ